MGRAPCCDKNGLKKGPWTTEEDQKLMDYIQKYGYGNWRTLPNKAGLQRCGKSCRLRWTNYLRPDIKRGRFSFEEEETIIQLHSILGNKWSAIAARLPGRTDNEIKNYWNTHIRKRLLRMGIDPVTHSPRLHLLGLSSILSNSSSSHMNISRLLGVQPLVNPELLRLANSLASSQRENQISVVQNCQENQFCTFQVENQYQLAQDNYNQFQSQLQEFSTCTSLASATIPSFPFSNETSQILDPNSEQFQPSISNFSSQLSHDWKSQIGMVSNINEEYEPLTSYYDSYYALGSDRGTNLVEVEPSSETSTLISNNNNFGFVSALSTPSSSPTSLNSKPTYVNRSNNTTECEREYYGNMMKFEIPTDILDVSNFV